MSVGIHFFRKDLRVDDNLALNELAKRVDSIIGLFAFDPVQIDKRPANAAYHSAHAAQFIIESVDDLKRQCEGKLVIQYGKPNVVLADLLKKTKATIVSFNSDFSPYSMSRDEELKRVCERAGVDLIVNEDDQCLLPMNLLTKADGSPYMVYGGFFKKLNKQQVLKPTTKRVKWLKPRGIKNSLPVAKHVENIFAGGREQALSYLKDREAIGATNKLANETSQLSAFMNQGCLSIREVYAAFSKRYSSIEPIRSIAWRDFFLCIYRFHPRGNTYDHIEPRYDMIKWPRVKESEWKRFLACDTGFLLVDAAMAELLKTGFINNRARLILATFWIKYLMIDPFDSEYGSQVWFSRLLIDCSASQNKLNHQWAIGDLDLSGRRFAMKKTHPLTGRSMRIDNDTIKQYDPTYTYLRKWIPRFYDKPTKECKEMMKRTIPMYEWKSRYAQYANLFEKIPK